jgi:hypothetical protein
MRYPDGGGLTPAARARGEQVRLEAAGLFATGARGGALTWFGPTLVRPEAGRGKLPRVSCLSRSAHAGAAGPGEHVRTAGNAQAFQASGAMQATSGERIPGEARPGGCLC